MAVLVTCKFDVDQIKDEGASVETQFSWEMTGHD